MVFIFPADSGGVAEVHHHKTSDVVGGGYNADPDIHLVHRSDNKSIVQSTRMS